MKKNIYKLAVFSFVLLCAALVLPSTAKGAVAASCRNGHKMGVRYRKQATATSTGYSGDYYCTVCGQVILKGKVIPKLTTTPTPKPTAKPKQKTLAVGTVIAANASGSRFKVMSNQKLSFIGTKKTTVTAITIPDSIKINGITYKVTDIASKALKGNTKIKKISIGKNVTKIGASAFYGCKNLSSITIKTKSLTAGKIGAKAFTGTKWNATVYVPKYLKTSYRKILRAKGLGYYATVRY